jgi:hypothetical protein
MTFVMWHYRNGWYVCSHFRRRPKRRVDPSTPPLFDFQVTSSSLPVLTS